MEKEMLLIMMEEYIRACLKMVFDMDLVYFRNLMDRYLIKEIGRKEVDEGQVNKYVVMDQSMSDGLKIIKLMVLERK